MGECEKVVQQMIEKLRTCDSDDREGLFQDLADQFRDTGKRLEELAADALPHACDDTARGAMDIFGKANALIDRIAILQHHRWDSLQSFRLCDAGSEGKWMVEESDKPNYVPFLNRDKFSSVGDVAETLEQLVLGSQQNDELDLAQDKGICVVFSRR